MCVCFRSALHEPESHHLLIKGAKAEGPGRRRSAAASSTRGRNRVPPKGANSYAMFMGQLLRPAALSLASTDESVVKVAGWWGWVGEGAEEKMHHRTNSVWIYSFISTIILMQEYAKCFSLSYINLFQNIKENASKGVRKPADSNFLNLKDLCWSNFTAPVFFSSLRLANRSLTTGKQFWNLAAI